MAKRVRIRGVSVPVKRSALSRKGYIGYSWKGKKRRIEVDRNLRGKALLSTMIHEMLHQLDHRLSERTVLELEEGIVELILENPEIFDRLWE